MKPSRRGFVLGCSTVDFCLGAIFTLASPALASETGSPLGVGVGLVTDDPNGPRPVTVHSGLLTGNSALLFGVVAVFLGLGLLLALALGTARTGEKSRVTRRLSFYTLTGRVKADREEVSALGDSSVARSAVELAGRVIASRDLESGLERQLERAGVPLRPAEWLLIHAGLTIGLAVFLLLLSGGGLPATVLGLALGLIAPMIFLTLKTSRRENAFQTQMPDTLQVMAGSLSAGYSLPQAVDAVVREGSKPIGTEFQRALVESRLGVPIEDGLDAVAERMGSRDFAWVVMAVRIQREVGGNLSEVLSTVASTMRERDRLRRQARVLSAEGRLSAWILGGLPILFGLYLVLVRPAYLHPLIHEPIGLVMLGFGAILFTVGCLWLRKVVNVEI